MSEPTPKPESSWANLVELLGLMLVLLGWGTITAAAAIVSTALGVLVAGVGLVLAGVLTVWTAAQLERAARTPAPDPDDAEVTV